jgi:peptidoglycan hydrolase-like protein with peptidoglycan-binding domain
MESPEQVSAHAEAPVAAPITATVIEGYLYGSMTLSAIASPETTQNITAPSEMGGVVTARVARRGQDVGSGDVILRVNGRPVFTLAGAFPMYRDIMPNDSGDDVAEVQKALTDAGLYEGPVDGEFGEVTQQAFVAMYNRAGYRPPRAPEAQPPSQDNLDGEQNERENGRVTRQEPKDTTGGPMILRQEVLFVPSLPATISSIADVGSTVTSDMHLLTFATSNTVLEAVIPVESLGPLTEGAMGSLKDDDGSEEEVSLESINSDGQDATLRFPANEHTLTQGNPYVLTLTNPANEPAQRLLVPTTSVTTRGGRSVVFVGQGLSFHEVEVTISGSVGGVVAISPARPEELAPGLAVLIGDHSGH